MARFGLWGVVGLTVALLASTVQAQDNGAMQDRLERIERDMNALQRNMYRNKPGAEGIPQDTADTAHLRAADDEAEEKLRGVNGRIEVLEHRMTTLEQKLEKFMSDVDFRFNEVSSKAALATPAPAPATPVDDAPEAEVKDEAEPTVPAKKEDQTLKTPKGSKTSFTNSKEHYDHAFKLLNQAKFDEAAKSLKGFIEQYPSDPLTGNAYYWLGEVSYAKRDYLPAADNFRQGFEKRPDGPKAWDNLLKLGMSLGALGKTSEACVVLNKVAGKSSTAVAGVKQTADKEAKRLSCSKS